MTPSRRKQSAWTQVAEYTSLAFLLPAATFAGYAVGSLLDRAFGTHFLYFVFLVLGVVGGFIELIRKVWKDMNANE